MRYQPERLAPPARRNTRIRWLVEAQLTVLHLTVAMSSECAAEAAEWHYSATSGRLTLRAIGCNGNVPNAFDATDITRSRRVSERVQSSTAVN